MKENRLFSTSSVLATALAAGLSATASAQLLYENGVPPAAPGGLSTGPTTNSGVAAPAGTNWSEVQADAGNTTESNTVAGYAISMDLAAGGVVPAGGFRLADEFTVPAGESWDIARIAVYAYTTGGAASPPNIDAVRLQIWNGPPGEAGSSVIFGDMTTNRLLLCENALLYRVFNTTTPPPGTAPGLTRIIWRVHASTLSGVTSGSRLTLGPGTYWFDFQTSNTANTAHFSPSLTVVGQRGTPGANARQYVRIDGTTTDHWQLVIDDGNPASAPDVPQDLPFQIHSGTPLTATGAANPATVNAGGSTLLTVAVTPGDYPPSSGIAVTGNLSAIGGSASQQFYDDGTNGDVTPNDNVFSYLATIPANSSFGSVTVSYDALDAQGRNAVGSIALTVLPTAQYTEVEPNDSKAQANAINGIVDGEAITGTSTSATGVGIDVFKIKTAPAPLGVYRHRLQLISAIAGHTGTLRGLNQLAAPPDTMTGIPWDGVIGNLGTTDTTIQSTSTTAVGNLPSRTNQWYGFGKEEEMFYRVTGTASTTQPYYAYYTVEPVTVNEIPGTFAPGLITINTNDQGHTTDTDLWVYDANFNAIPGYGSDDSSAALSGAPIPTTSLRSWLPREYAPGTYYLAISNFQMAHANPSPSDDNFRTGTLLDFPHSIANSSTAVNLNLTFTIADSGARHTVLVPNTKVGAFDVNWFKFVVASPCAAADINCDGVVNVNDLLIVINSWGVCPAPPADCPADITGDGVVNVNDLLAVINAWGPAR